MAACYYLEEVTETTKQKWSLRVLGLPNRSICNILACKYLYLILCFLILSSFQYVLFDNRQ